MMAKEGAFPGVPVTFDGDYADYVLVKGNALASIPDDLVAILGVEAWAIWASSSPRSSAPVSAAAL